MENIEELKQTIALQGIFLAEKDASLAEKDASLAEKDMSLAEKERRIAELEALVMYYEGQQRLALSQKYGASSEKGVASDQLDLFNEAEATADPYVPEPAYEEIAGYKRHKRIGKRADDLSLLPVGQVTHTLAEDEQICPVCGNTLHVMGHEICHREIVIIPPRAELIEHIQEVYSCRHCEQHGDHVPIIKAPVPEPVIKGSLASPSAVAHIMTQKYVMHNPLYRQEKDWERQGVYLSRQTMGNWVIRCAEDWFQVLYDKLRQELLQREVLHADETTCQVLKEPGKSPTSKSYMWLYRTSGDAERNVVLFEYQPSRSHLHPERFLSGWSGLLHADGYAGYHKLPHGITVVGCWTHMRRKWTDAQKTLPKDDRDHSICQQAIHKINYLFHLESLWKDLSPEERFLRRREESVPLAEAYFAWVESLGVLPKTGAGTARHYALEQKQWLMNVFIDGRTDISNNRIENSVRPFAQGRRNWLFFDTVKGAEASSIIYSLIETAVANGLKPFEYLKFLLETLPNSTSSAIDSLLPWGSAVPDSCRMPQPASASSGISAPDLSIAADADAGSLAEV